MSQLLYDRKIIVELGVAGGLGKRYTGLRVKFQVEKTIEDTPNKAKIQVYNLTRDNRALAEQKNTVIRLLAGYGDEPELVYQGDVDPKASRTELQGVDYVTTFECGDGQVAYETSSHDKTYTEGTSIKDVIGDLVSSLKTTIIDAVDIPNSKILNGLSVTGMAQKSLTEVTKKVGLGWSIQDGQVQITKKDGPTQKTAILLTPRTGLIGIPKNKGDGIEFTSLLQPKINPGQIVTIDSKFIRGEFVAQKVNHSGDNFAADFYTIVEASKR